MNSALVPSIAYVIDLKKKPSNLNPQNYEMVLYKSYDKHPYTIQLMIKTERQKLRNVTVCREVCQRDNSKNKYKKK